MGGKEERVMGDCGSSWRSLSVGLCPVAAGEEMKGSETKKVDEWNE